MLELDDTWKYWTLQLILGLIKAGARSYWLALHGWPAWLEADIKSVGSLDIVLVIYRPRLLSVKGLQGGKLLVWSLIHIAAFVSHFDQTLLLHVRIQKRKV